MKKILKQLSKVGARPELKDEIAKAKGKKYIIMSDVDVVEYSTDDRTEALLAFAAVMARKPAESGYGPKHDLEVLAIPDALGEGITPSGKGMVGFARTMTDGEPDGEVLAVGFGISEEEWDRYGPDSTQRKKLKRESEGKPADYAYAYVVMSEKGGPMLETDDQDEAFRVFAKVSLDATRHYGYGPGNPVAIQFNPVPDHIVENYPNKDRLRKKSILISTISGFSVMLAALEGVTYEEWEPVADKYLGLALGGEENVKKISAGQEITMQEPIGLKSEADAVEELGARYVVMDEDNAVRLKTDDEYEAVREFYKAQEESFGGKDMTAADLTIKDGPRWSGTMLPTLVAQYGDKKVIAIIGMSKKTHDLLMEPQSVVRGDRKSPWNATVH